MTNTKLAAPGFREGDAVVLAEGTYQGTLGLFLRLKDDSNWADIVESSGRTRSHPVAWLAPAGANQTRQIARPVVTTRIGG